MRNKFLFSRRCALGVAMAVTVVYLPAGLARGGNGEFSYPFSCTWASLTADFADRDALRESREPATEWYRTNAEGHYLNGGWGPAADTFPAPAIPKNAQCDSSTWKQERIIAVAMRYIYAPGNSAGLQYRHHHIPGWNPPTSTYAGAPGENPDADNPDAPTAWDPGKGLDCSNFTAWVYNYGLGIKFSGDVHRQADGSAGPLGRRIPKEGSFEAGDLIYLHPSGDAGRASHVVIYIDDAHIVDSRVNAQNRVGVQVRDRVGWYRDAVLGAWRPIG